MRRALVLTNESARHPFRASLPPFIFAVDEIERRRPWRESLWFDRNDLTQALQVYCACFLATAVFFY